MAMRDWITNDFGWKLFSLFLAVAIWLTVHKIYEEPGAAFGPAAGDTVTFGNLPVRVVSAASDVRDFRAAPLTVKVTVSGPAEDMAKLQADQRSYQVLADINTRPRTTYVAEVLNLNAELEGKPVEHEPGKAKG